MKFLPTRNDPLWGYANLNGYFEKWSRGRQLDPDDDDVWMAQMVSDLHAERGIDGSYGGYLENRAALLGHTYLAREGHFLHLGVDLNVPEGNLVATSRTSWVEEFDDDHPETHGWGTRAVLRFRDDNLGWVYMIYAHLAHDGALLTKGARIEAGTVFARVGGPRTNGGWFPHLHVQAVTEDAWARIGLGAIDGYGHPDREAELARDFPDPLPLLLAPCLDR